jgi:O-antigen biosynthesis protein
MGAEGLGLVQNRDAMIADDPQEFAERVLGVYHNEDVWQHLSDAGYHHIENHFTPQVIGERIETSLRSLGVEALQNRTI